MYVVPPKKADAPAAPAAAADAAAPPPSPADALARALRDAEVKVLQDSKLPSGSEEDRAAYDALLARLLAAHPGHLPLLREPLRRAMAPPAAGRSAEARRGIVAAADAVLAAVDATELAVHVAQKCPEEGAGAAARAKEMEERRAAVVEALAAKCAALLDLEEEEAAGPGGGGEGAAEGGFDAAFAELRRWADPAAEGKHAVLLARREARAGRVAGAVRALEKAANPEDKPAAREVLEQRKALFERLGWAHWARAEEARIRRAFPPAQRPPF